jgi:hypothetical protein
MSAVWIVVYLALGVVQVTAFMEGVETWLGWNLPLQIVAFVVCLFLGPIGALVITPLGFYGASVGWGWPWWQALLLTAPFLVFSIAAFALGGAAARFRRRTPA